MNREYRQANPATVINYFESMRLGWSRYHQNYRKNFIRNRFHNAKDLYRFDLLGHYSCVNALDVSKDQQLLASGGDCMRVLVWNIDGVFGCKDYRAIEMEEKHDSNIFAVAFSSDRSYLFSGGNDGMILAHDPNTGRVKRTFKLPWQVVSSIAVNPLEGEICMAATSQSVINGISDRSADGNAVYLLDMRVPWGRDARGRGLPKILFDGAPHCVQYHPLRANCVATGDSSGGLLQWDLRTLSQFSVSYQYDDRSHEGIMSLCWSSDGSRLASLPKRGNAWLYATGHSQPVASFTAEGFGNGCTFKSVTFAGPDEEYVVTGSDDFQVYMWRHDILDASDVPNRQVAEVKDASLILTDHRSIVNQVRYCARHYALFSSGVEKMVKVWSAFPSVRSKGSLDGKCRSELRKRRDPSQIRSQPLIGPVPNDSVEEDPVMLLFFDRLLYEEEKIGREDTSPFYIMHSSSISSAASAVDEEMSSAGDRPTSDDDSPSSISSLSSSLLSLSSTSSSSSSTVSSTSLTTSSSDADGEPLSKKLRLKKRKVSSRKRTRLLLESLMRVDKQQKSSTKRRIERLQLSLSSDSSASSDTSSTVSIPSSTGISSSSSSLSASQSPRDAVRSSIDSDCSSSQEGRIESKKTEAVNGKCVVETVSTTTSDPPKNLRPSITFLDSSSSDS